jgi:hypothetical protein
MNTGSVEKWEHVTRRGAARFLAVLGVGVLGGVEFLANYLLPVVLRDTVQFRPGEALDGFVRSVVIGVATAAGVWLDYEWRYKRVTPQALKSQGELAGDDGGRTRQVLD